MLTVSRFSMYFTALTGIRHEFPRCRSSLSLVYWIISYSSAVSVRANSSQECWRFCRPDAKAFLLPRLFWAFRLWPALENAGGKFGMAKTFRASRAILRRSAISKAHPLGLHGHRALVCREFRQYRLSRKAFLSKTIVHRLTFRVVPSAKFIEIFLIWLLIGL